MSRLITLLIKKFKDLLETRDCNILPFHSYTNWYNCSTCILFNIDYKDDYKRGTPYEELLFHLLTTN